LAALSPGPRGFPPPEKVLVETGFLVLPKFLQNFGELFGGLSFRSLESPKRVRRGPAFFFSPLGFLD